MRKDKENAVKLRKFGKSYNEIKAELGIPKSTLSAWFRDQKWSNEIAQKLLERLKSKSIIRLQQLGRIRGDNLKRLYEEAESEAIEDFDALKFHPLFIAGIVIYWGEGDKVSKNGFRISNSDPDMVRLFADFLRKICHAENGRIKANLLIYPDIDDSQAKEFWIQKTGLKYDNFTKSVLIKGRHKTRKVKFGICVLSYSSTFLKKKMKKWIELLAKEFVNF